MAVPYPGNQIQSQVLLRSRLWSSTERGGRDGHRTGLLSLFCLLLEGFFLSVPELWLYLVYRGASFLCCLPGGPKTPLDLVLVSHLQHVWDTVPPVLSHAPLLY